MTISTASLLLSAVVAIATVIYAILTWKLVAETSRLRAQTDARMRAEVAELVQSILSEYSRIADFARRIEIEVKGLAGFTGRSSWTEQRTSELRAIPSELKPYAERLRSRPLEPKPS